MLRMNWRLNNKWSYWLKRDLLKQKGEIFLMDHLKIPLQK
jgi:hypothetical protein